MTSAHNHGDGFRPTSPPEPFAGHPVNEELLCDLMGAAVDGCVPCQKQMIPRVAEDPVATARLVGLACISLAGVLGGVPSTVGSPAWGFASAEFRAVAVAGVDQPTEEDTARGLLGATEPLTPQQRREAVDSALDLLAGAV
jgi:hypothetical protein